jgi:hypothetical protein
MSSLVAFAQAIIATVSLIVASRGDAAEGAFVPKEMAWASGRRVSHLFSCSRGDIFEVEIEGMGVLSNPVRLNLADHDVSMQSDTA